MMSPEDGVAWALDQFMELWARGNSLGVSRVDMRYALISFLVMDEWGNVESGVDPVTMKTFDREALMDAYSTVFGDPVESG